MFIELVSALRCVRPHEEGWLVAATHRMEGRHVLDGVLGCPTCRAEYPVRDGVADFADGAAPSVPVSDAAGGEDDAGEAMRLAALLALEEPVLPVVLCGDWARLLAGVGEIVPAATFLLVNARPDPDAPPVSALLARGVLPLAVGAAHAVALDEPTAGDAGLVEGLVRALAAGGRMAGPAEVPVPGGMRELARDGRHWVAERIVEPAVTPPQPLLRRR